MAVKWFHSLLHRSSPARVESGPVSHAPILTDAKKGVLVDVVYEALQKDMAFRQEVLKELEKVGWNLFKRKQFKFKVRSKIKQAMLPELADGEGESLLVDEITERIVDAAESDPFYQRLFRSSEEE